MDRFGVVGGGTMGAGIAEVFARAGRSVVVREVDQTASDRAAARIEGSLAKAVGTAKLEGPDADAALNRIEFVTDWDALHDAALVVEAWLRTSTRR